MSKIAALALALFAAAANADPATDLTALNTVGEIEWRFADSVAESGPGEERSYLVTAGIYRISNCLRILGCSRNQ